MGLATSGLRDRMIFCFGARRSGTYWLHRVLAAHPEVSEVPSETALFSHGIKPLFERFHHGSRSSPTVGQMYVDRATLLDATRDFCDRILEPFLEPGSRYLCERTPMHAQAVDVIAAVYPDARLIHIVRDGRDVARSLVARSWGPSTVADAATEWRDTIEGVRAAAPAERYLEVRYEDLLSDRETHVARLLEWLELPSGGDALAACIAESERGRNEDPADSRKVWGKWRDHFSAEELAAFNAQAGALLAELGYPDAEALPAGGNGHGPAAAPQPAAVPAGEHAERRTRPADRARAALRRLRQAVPQGANDGELDPTQWDVGGPLAQAQTVVDRLLESLHSGRAASFDGVTDGLVVRSVTAGGVREATGREALGALLGDDPAWNGRQVRAEKLPGLPTFSMVLAYELPDGGRADRLLAVTLRGRAAEAVTVYRL